jgi:hypothetical protein
MNCEHCKHAMITHGKQVSFTHGNTKVTAIAKNNIHCECESIRSLIFTGDDIICKDFTKKVLDK